MGKRSSFRRIERDYYPTPGKAIDPLLPHLPETTSFVEPCAGDGRMMIYLSNAGHLCVDAWDIEPQHKLVSQRDATTAKDNSQAEFFITNPPWDRSILHPLIGNLATQKPTWLLFDADWMHTKQSAPFMDWCRVIVSVGRVKWIEDSPHTGKDNCAWYLFDEDDSNYGMTTEFWGRI